MAKNVFISFRYSDGKNYKKRLSEMFDLNYDTVDFSEDADRSQMSDETIKKHLYEKLRRSSVTIILLTPDAINHEKNYLGKYDDWMYDEIRYSLEDRNENRTNGLIAVYTPEAKDQIIINKETWVEVKNVDNLFRKNMMNVKPQYKKNKKQNIFDNEWDSYCSLVSWETFTKNIDKYIKNAVDKRENIDRYNIIKRL